MEQKYFEVSIKLDKTQENGLTKKVTEKYLIEAMSFTEAEARAVEYITPYVSGEFDITAIRRTKIAEIFESKDERADRFYSAKVAFITVDERTAVEKRVLQQVIVRATDFDDARNVLQDGMSGSMADWEKAQLSETNIIDLVPYLK